MLYSKLEEIWQQRHLDAGVIRLLIIAISVGSAGKILCIILQRKTDTLGGKEACQHCLNKDVLLVLPEHSRQ